MKTLLIVSTFLFGMNSFAQDFIVETLANHQLIYRGFENKVTFNQAGCQSVDYTIEAVNCTVEKLNITGNTNTYVIKTKSSAKTAKIYFMVDGKKADSASFMIQNLPSPNLYWGYNESGNDFSDAPTLTMKYEPGIGLKSPFQILEWLCNINGKEYRGSGTELTPEFLAFTKTIAAGEAIAIVVTYSSGDGMVRQTSGSWIKK